MYEYECEACGDRFELIRKFSDPPVEICPKCGAPNVRKLVSSPAIQFKGSGFYINDYARKSVGESESSKADAATEAKSSDKGSSDKGSSDKGSSDKGSSDKGSSDKGSSDKGSSDKGSSDKTSAASGSTSSSSSSTDKAPAASSSKNS